MSTWEHSSPQLGHCQPSRLSPLPLSPLPLREPLPLPEKGGFEESPPEPNVPPISFENDRVIAGTRKNAMTCLLAHFGWLANTAVILPSPDFDPERTVIFNYCTRMQSMNYLSHSLNCIARRCQHSAFTPTRSCMSITTSCPVHYCIY